MTAGMRSLDRRILMHFKFRYYDIRHYIQQQYVNKNKTYFIKVSI